MSDNQSQQKESLSIEDQANRIWLKFGGSAIQVVCEIMADNEYFYIQLNRYPGMTNLEYWQSVKKILWQRIRN